MEHKIRVWLSNDEYPNGKMFYPGDDAPYLLNLNCDVLSSTKKGSFNYDVIWARIGNNQIDTMLFINKCDRNNEEIYEHDIVRFFNTEGRMFIKEVLWDENNCCFCFGNMSIERLLMSGYIQNWELEIIGNTFENPNLLSEVTRNGISKLPDGN
jgi:hypothetical protein